MKNEGNNENTAYTGFNRALALIGEYTGPSGTEICSLADCPDYVLAEDICALVSNPTNDISLKDGYAIRSADSEHAAEISPVELKNAGSVFAGGSFSGEVVPGQTVKIFTGALVPDGADAVVPSEFCDEDAGTVRVKTGVSPGENIMPAGEDVAAETKIAGKGELLTPARLAFLAVAGIERVTVYRKPRVAIITTGDEMIMPGEKLKSGQVYASNAVQAGAWLSLLGIPYTNALVNDNTGSLRETLTGLLPGVDAIITGGGTMHGEHDLVTGVLDDLGWEMKFRHVRMRPGKGTAFGVLRGKPVFCLPGGAAGYVTGFLTLALPGVCRMSGFNSSPLLGVRARLTRDILGSDRDWTEFRQGRLELSEGGDLLVSPVSGVSRMKAMAEADCLLCKEEGTDSLHRNQSTTVRLLLPAFAAFSGITP